MSLVAHSPLVRRLQAPNPSPWTLDGTNTYLVGSREPVVIDPGPNIDAHLDAIVEAAGGAIGGIMLTHRHPDHAEGLDALIERTGAGVLGDPVVEVDGARLTRIATPGHASDHVCFLLDVERALFSGDHVLGRGTTVVAHPDGDMAAYLSSLNRVIELAPARIYPGHGPLVESPAEVLDFYRRHRLEREAKVFASLGEAPATLEALLPRAYDDVDEAVWPAARMSLAAHLDKLVAEGRAIREPAGWRR